MFRRNFLISGAGAIAALAQTQKKEDEPKIAGATQDPTPRVGIVLSSFKEGEDDDGTKIAGLSDPQPATADLTPTQFDALIRKGIDLAARRTAEFYETIEPEDWIVVLTQARVDARIVSLMISYLADQKRGVRFTVAARLPQAGQWAPEYQKLVGDFTAKYKGVRFELVDLNTAPTVEMPVPEKASVSYAIPKVIQQCDRVISIAPLATDSTRGVSLSVANYASLVAKPVTTDEALIDLFSYKPADFALVGGSMGFEGDGSPVHYNLVVAGMKAVAVDSTAATVMGFKPEDLPLFALGQKRGFGSWDRNEVWVRGSEIKDAQREFKKPSGWHKP